MSEAQIQALSRKLEIAVAAGDERTAAKAERKLRKLCRKAGVDYESAVRPSDRAEAPQEAAPVAEPEPTAAPAPEPSAAPAPEEKPAAPVEARGRRGRKAEQAAHEAALEVVPNDRSTQALMGYDLMHPDGVMRLDSGHYSVTLELDDVNYVGCRPEEQESKRETWAQWLDGTDSQTGIQMLVVTRQISRSIYEDNLEFLPVEGDETGNAFRSELNAWCKDKLNKTTRSMSRRRLCTITVAADSYEKAAPKLAHQATRLIKCMQTLESGARVLNAQQRLDALRKMTHQDDEPGTVDLKAEQARRVPLSTKDLAAPYRVLRLNEWRGDPRMVVGRRHVQSMTVLVDGYGNAQSDDFVTDLISVPFDVSVSMHIRPWEADVAAAMVDRQLFEVQTENHSYQQKNSRPQLGYFIDDENMPVSMKEAEGQAKALREDLKTEHLYSVVLNVLCEGRDAEELKAAVAEVEGVFKKHKKSVPDSWSALREQAFTSTLPTGRCLLPYERTLTTVPLSHMIPFASLELKDEDGIIMGINADSRDFIIYNPAEHEHANAFVIAQPGKGKSMNMKLTRILQTRLRHPDDDVVVIDPEGEDTAFVPQLGGEVLVISQNPDNPTRINPLDISTSYGDSVDAVASARAQKVTFLRDLVHVMYPTVTAAQLAAVDAIGMDAYAAWVLDPVQENVPTFQDIYDRLEAHESPEVQRLAAGIKPYIDGSQALFNSKTTVDMDSRLVSFDLSKLPESTKRLALLVLLDHIWVRVTRNKAQGRRTWLVIDEFQLLMDDDAALKQFEYFFCRGRKWNLYEIAATQNLDRLVQNERAMAMLQSSPFLTFFNQNEAATRTFASLLSFSDDQIHTLRTAKPGEGLYVVGNKVIHFDFTIDRDICPSIYNAVTTRPSDLEDIKNKRLASKGAKAAEAPDGEYLEALKAELAARTDENLALRARVAELEAASAGAPASAPAAAPDPSRTAVLPRRSPFAAALERPVKVAEAARVDDLDEPDAPPTIGDIPLPPAPEDLARELARAEAAVSEGAGEQPEGAEDAPALSPEAAAEAEAQGLDPAAAYGAGFEFAEDEPEESTFAPQRGFEE